MLKCQQPTAIGSTLGLTASHLGLPLRWYKSPAEVVLTLERNRVSLDSKQFRELYNALINARDAVAEEINQLDANPPQNQEEFIAIKTTLMNRWRDLSIARVRVAYAAGGQESTL